MPDYFTGEQCEYYTTHGLSPEVLCRYLADTGCTALYLDAIDGAFAGAYGHLFEDGLSSGARVYRIEGGAQDMRFVPVPEGGLREMKKLAKALSALIGDSRRLIAACYALFFAGSVLAAVLGWAEDGVQRLLGNVAEAQVTVEDFDLVDIEREGDVCRSTSYDPRMTLRDAPAYGAHRHGARRVHGRRPGRVLRVL